MARMYIDPVVYKDAWHMDLYRAIMAIIVEVIFKPLADVLAEVDRADNAALTALQAALRKGTIQYKAGGFEGKISAAISKEIRTLGGKFVRGKWYIPSTNMPKYLLDTITAQGLVMALLERKVEEAMAKMPALAVKMVQNMTTASLGAVAVDRVSVAFKHELNKKLSILPDLGEEGRAKFKAEYFDVDDKPIKEKCLFEYENGVRDAVENFTQETITKLRVDIKALALGGRPRQEIRDLIQARLNVSPTRAKFIARQETALLTVEYQKIRHIAAGQLKYKWLTVGDHIVRTVPNGGHKVLANQEFAWDNPPSARHFCTKKACHPGEDYNCRCLARTIVEWK
jgi:hypothetical protein